MPQWMLQAGFASKRTAACRRLPLYLQRADRIVPRTPSRLKEPVLSQARSADVPAVSFEEVDHLVTRVRPAARRMPPRTTTAVAKTETVRGTRPQHKGDLAVRVRKVRARWAEAISHTRQIPSLAPAANQRPSGDQATA